MALVIVLTTYAYDCAMSRFKWRWTLFSAVFIALFVLIFASTNNPVGWVITHFTFTPQTGFYRILIWDAATNQISRAPFTGSGFVLFGNYLLDRTVDSVWLVLGLRYGIPMIVLMILFNISAFLPAGRRSIETPGRSDQMRTAFTLVLLVFMFTGLTVHFWNYMWIFWGLCVGIRASLREQSISGSVG